MRELLAMAAHRYAKGAQRWRRRGLWVRFAAAAILPRETRAMRARERGRALGDAFRFSLRGGFCLAAAAISRRRAAAQPGLFTWRPRAMASASGGILSVIVDPAAI